jgi:hypothetical protein
MQNYQNYDLSPPTEDNFDFWKNIFLCVIFALVAPLTLITSIFSLSIITQNDLQKAATKSYLSKELESSGVKLFASLPSKGPTVSGLVESADARPEKIKKYLKTYDSLLYPYSGTLVEAADFYGIDYRLLPAIAQQESNLCKRIPPETHNCWGWGIHSAGTLGFQDYDSAIWTVARGLKYEYIDKGYSTPEEIMSKYTPLSNGSWAAGVSTFMQDL